MRVTEPRLAGLTEELLQKNSDHIHRHIRLLLQVLKTAGGFSGLSATIRGRFSRLTGTRPSYWTTRQENVFFTIKLSPDIRGGAAVRRRRMERTAEPRLAGETADVLHL